MWDRHQLVDMSSDSDPSTEGDGDMKLYANYDSSGKVHSLTLLNAPPEFGMMLIPKGGTFHAEVEGLALEETDFRDPKRLRELVSHQKVARTGPPRVTLTPIDM